MTKCHYCTRQAVNEIEGKVALCEECSRAYCDGFNDGRLYQAKLRRVDPQRAKLIGRWEKRDTGKAVH